MLAVNLRGVFLSVKACLPQMIRQRYGHIAVTSSTTGPKTAVNGVEPGPILSDGVAALLDEAALRQIAAPLPMQKLDDPENFAHGLLFLRQ